MRERAERNRSIMNEAKSKPCMDCGGIFDPICMDFDHRPGSVKVTAVASMLNRNVSLVLKEIAKCDVVCSNCHRLRTYRLRNYLQVSHGPTENRQLAFQGLADDEEDSSGS